MTKREAKAVKMVRKSCLVKYKNRDVRFMSDEELLQSGACQGYIEMADWMAKECAGVVSNSEDELSNHFASAILNTGKEEV